MKIVIIGLGSIGQRHARLLHETSDHELVALRSKPSPINHMLIKEVYRWDDVVQYKPDVAFVTNPTSLHISTAMRCAQLGCTLFLEKPIGHSHEGLDELISYIRAHRIVSYVAYNLRFHPVIEKIKEYMNRGTFLHMSVVCSSFLPSWRPGSDVKMSYSSQAVLGGGVILDLSHDLDYTEYLLGPIQSIMGNFSRRSDITVDAEDWADMLISCERGPAIIHLNIFSQIKQRLIQIDFKEFSIAADLINGEMAEFRNGNAVGKHTFNCSRDYSYTKQLEYFLHNINNDRMMNSIPAASELFKKILDFKEQCAYHG